MAKAKMVCRVCEKEYEACYTFKTGVTFRWQDVACSVECGAEYLRRVMEARNPVAQPKAEESEEISVVAEEVQPLPFEEDVEEEELVEFEEIEEDEELIEE